MAVCLQATPPCLLLLLLIGQLAVTPDLLNIPEPWLEHVWRRTRRSQWLFLWKGTLLQSRACEERPRNSTQDPSPPRTLPHPGTPAMVPAPGSGWCCWVGLLVWSRPSQAFTHYVSSSSPPPGCWTRLSKVLHPDVYYPIEAQTQPDGGRLAGEASKAGGTFREQQTGPGLPDPPPFIKSFLTRRP